MQLVIPISTLEDSKDLEDRKENSLVYKIKLEKSASNLLDTLQSMGDFLLLNKSECILNSKTSKTKVRNKIKKITGNDFEMMITELNQNDIQYYPDIVKSWFLAEQLEQKIKKISIEDVKLEALNRLDSFIDALEKELQNSQKGGEG